jgi:cytochrome P450
MFVLIISLAFTLFVSVILLLLTKKKKSHPLLVRAKGDWLLGNVDDFKSETFLKTLEEFPMKYGPFVELYLLVKRALIISDTSAAKELLLKRPKNFCRIKSLEYAGNILNIQTTLFLAKGHTWQRIRKLCSPTFNHLNIGNKVIAIAKELFTWVKSLKDDPTLAHKSTDMQKECFSITTRVITVVAYGLPTDHPLVAYFLGPFQQDVLKSFAFSGASAIFPFPRFFWKYSSKYALEADAVAATSRGIEEGRKIVNYKRQLLKEGKLTTANCMVDSMVLNEGNSTEKALSDLEIVVNVRGFYIAGADTTSITLTWGAYYFALYPEVAEKLRQEAMEVLFRGKSPQNLLQEDFDMNIFPQMVYTHAVINEILRLKTPASNISLELEEEKDEYTLANGITIYSGDLVYVNIDGIHTDPNIFENPFAFQPERWLTTDTDKLTKMQEAFIPFGFGSRICPGMGLAMHESLLALAFFAYYFQFTLNCPKEEIIRKSSFVATVNKMPMIVTPRTDIIE